MVIPQALPARKVPGYQMPETSTNLLSWDFVAAQMEPSQHYWISTVFADGRPHAVAVWGISGTRTGCILRAACRRPGRAIWCATPRSITSTHLVAMPNKEHM